MVTWQALVQNLHHGQWILRDALNGLGSQVDWHDPKFDDFNVHVLTYPEMHIINENDFSMKIRAHCQVLKSTEQTEWTLDFWRLLANYETDSKYYQKIFCPCLIFSVLFIYVLVDKHLFCVKNGK